MWKNRLFLFSHSWNIPKKYCEDSAWESPFIINGNVKNIVTRFSQSGFFELCWFLNDFARFPDFSSKGAWRTFFHFLQDFFVQFILSILLDGFPLRRTKCRKTARNSDFRKIGSFSFLFPWRDFFQKSSERIFFRTWKPRFLIWFSFGRRVFFGERKIKKRLFNRVFRQNSRQTRDFKNQPFLFFEPMKNKMRRILVILHEELRLL